MEIVTMVIIFKLLDFACPSLTGPISYSVTLRVPLTHTNTDAGHKSSPPNFYVFIIHLGPVYLLEASDPADR